MFTRQGAHALFTPKNTSDDNKAAVLYLSCIDKSIELQSHNKKVENIEVNELFFAISINTKGNVNVSHIIGISNFWINLVGRYKTLIAVYNEILFADYIEFYISLTIFEIFYIYT